MVTLALYVTMEPKPGKEAEVEAFLKSAQPLVKPELLAAKLPKR